MSRFQFGTHRDRLPIRRLFACAALALACSGCAIGNHGTLLARRTVAGGAEILDVYAFGLLIRPGGFDAGISLGYRHATYIFPLASIAEPRGSDWRWFHAPVPAADPLVTASTSLGLETQFTPDIRRITLGYLDQMIIGGGSPQESRAVSLRYKRSDPSLTYLAMTNYPSSFLP